MKSYEIDFKNDVNLKEIKKLFLGNGFLHLKNILNINEITKIKENILKEFGCLDKQQLNIEDKKTLDRCEMPVTHEKCPRIDINSYKAHINSRLPDVLKVIFEEDFLWHFPPQVRRLSIEKEIGLLPFHQDYYYNANYKNIMVCWTPLSKCGENAPSLDLVNKTIKEKIEHKSNEIWEFGISPEIFNKYASEDEIISLTDVNIGDVVIFDAYNLHRTYRNENMNQIRYSMDLRCIKKSFIKEDLLKMRDYVNSSDLERKSNERNKI